MTIQSIAGRRRFIEEFLREEQTEASFDLEVAARQGGFVWSLAEGVCGYAADYPTARLDACDRAIRLDDPRPLRYVADISARDQWAIKPSPDEAATIDRYCIAHFVDAIGGIDDPLMQDAVVRDLRCNPRDVTSAMLLVHELALAKEVVRREAILEAGGQRSTASSLAALGPAPRALSDRFSDLPSQQLFEKGLELAEGFRGEASVCRGAALLFAHKRSAIESMMNSLTTTERVVVARARLEREPMKEVAAVMGVPLTEVSEIATKAGRKLHRLSLQLPAVDRDLERAVERTASQSLSLRL